MEANNAAALREALEKIRDYELAFCEKMEANNAAALREALEKIRDDELAFCEKNAERGIGLSIFGLSIHCEIIRKIIEAALAVPPRNCDVGTAEDQEKRFDAYCTGLGMCPRCLDCTTLDYRITNDPFLCMMEWEQLPYEAQEGAGR